MLVHIKYNDYEENYTPLLPELQEPPNEKIAWEKNSDSWNRRHQLFAKIIPALFSLDDWL